MGALDKTGRFEWHDHRIHLFTSATPKTVTDKAKRTKIFSWSVPITVGGQVGAISGTLFWRGQSSEFPVWALVSMLVIVLGGAVVVMRAGRRRAAVAGDREPPAREGDSGTPARRPDAW